MSLQALSNYTYYSKYAQWRKGENRRERWPEATARVMDMHRKRYEVELERNPDLAAEIDFAEKQILKRRVLGSQRALQYGGEDTLKKNERIYNCSGLHITKPKAFQDVVWLLLMGCGVGFSVQKEHVAKLSPISRVDPEREVTFQIPDTCEGWADSVGVLLSSYFVDGGHFPDGGWRGKRVVFDPSLVRPQGSLIAGKFKAPGPDPLIRGLERVRALLERLLDEGRTRLRPIDCYDILMHCSDFVISAGLRRSASICLFSKDDEEMATAKTGRWFVENPQRGRSNNSVALKRDDVTREEFRELFRHIKEFGEPGWVFVDDYQQLTNPCAEITWSFPPSETPGECTVGFCNLTEINGRFCDTEENFLQACRAAAILGTLQAGYTDFPYLGKSTEELVRREALLGVSITGWMDNPEILFNPKILERGAAEVRKVNKRLAGMLGINPAARLTCAKPSGNTSCILGTASGIHPHHARRYIRRTQSNTQEWALGVFKRENPIAVEPSVWSANGTDAIVSFLCEVPPGAVLKNQIGAVELLQKVLVAQRHWVNKGVNPERNSQPGLAHAVSNTITVKPEEWEETEEFIFKNRNYFSGISLLGASGDLDYEQAPFSTVLTPAELVREYGDASVFASGLVVDGLHAFATLWGACNTALGVGETLGELPEEPVYPKSRTNGNLARYFTAKAEYETLELKRDWVRRVNQFADRYFGGDLRRATYCLKHVSLWKTWCDLKREYREIDWEGATEETQELKDADTQAAVACNGGACELV